MALRGKPLVIAMCIGQVGNLLPHVAVPAVMAAHLIPQWELTASEAGLMASAFAVGYMLSVLVLTTLTDRVDARFILLLGSSLSGLATIAFGLFAQGLASATALWGLVGIGFAGAYMPGLKALTDRLGAGDSSRSITLYTATFSLGVGASFLVAQHAADQFGWRAAFYATGWGPILMIVPCLLMEPVKPIRSSRRLFDFGPVFRNRAALGYILGYGVHCFELYALRTWIVAFWAYVAARYNGGALLAPVTVSVISAVLAMPASIVGNEAAIKFGRDQAIICAMVLSAMVALVIGISVETAPAILLTLLLVYSVTIPADSGALTSGMSLNARSEHRGATMALHSTVGFGLSAAGSWLTGVAIDLGGGINTSEGWVAAFLLMGFSALCGPICLWTRRRRAKGAVF